ncbi:MAG: HRDC domain-containing protein [Muribaculaceae bacterium]|nr:HRDC domain-containing protein [Muribaculaceae bacterium]
MEGIPPYPVMTDKTLHEIAVRRPITRAQFGAVPGIGELKEEKYWRHVTRLVAKF